MRRVRIQALQVPTAAEYDAAIEAWNMAQATRDRAAMLQAEAIINAYQRRHASREARWERRNG